MERKEKGVIIFFTGLVAMPFVPIVGIFLCALSLVFFINPELSFKGT